MSLVSRAGSSPPEKPAFIGAPTPSDAWCHGWEDLTSRTLKGDFDSYICLLQDMADWIELQDLPQFCKDRRADLRRETLRAVHAGRHTLTSAPSVHLWFGAISAEKLKELSRLRSPVARSGR